MYRRVVEGRRRVGSNEEARQQFEELIKVAESLGPVVQSIVSLMSSLRGQVVNRFRLLIFFVEKMREVQKLLTFFRQKILANLRYNVLTFEILTKC